MRLSVYWGTIYNNQDTEAIEMSIARCIDKENVVYIHMILLSHKKEWNNAMCSNMDGPRGYHTMWNKPEEDKYHAMSVICGYLKKKKKKKIQMNIFPKEKRDSQT